MQPVGRAWSAKWYWKAEGAAFSASSHTVTATQKGEVANDYSDIGQEFWGGVLVSVAGKEVLPEDEIEGRRDELLPIIGPRTEAEETNTAAHGDDVNGNDEAAGKAENEVAAAAAAA